MPKLKRAPIKSLRPTQLTVGMLEVEVKRKRLASLSPTAREAFLQAHPMPVVIGPEECLYITDHHHLARAALEARVRDAWFTIEADFSSYGARKFWLKMTEHSWVHPLDEHGVRHDYRFIPRHLKKLTDDIYRSLAGFVRDAGGFEKTGAAFVEFIWADFFRRNIAIEDVRANFRQALRDGKRLARSPLAKRIPGFTG
ncbi:MAG TPA: ParB-like protein [Steroidobacteraceae bacterium]|jgi:hypothetical protein|nr:ParB-like protein [Steroidobacteraceae bacterium]